MGRDGESQCQVQRQPRACRPAPPYVMELIARLLNSQQLMSVALQAQVPAQTPGTHGTPGGDAQLLSVDKG